MPKMSESTVRKMVSIGTDVTKVRKDSGLSTVFKDQDADLIRRNSHNLNVIVF